MNRQQGNELPEADRIKPQAIPRRASIGCRVAGTRNFLGYGGLMRIWRRACALGVLCAALGTTAAAASEYDPARAGELPSDVRLPNDTVVAVYMPANALAERYYVSSLGLWAEPGKALDDARRELGPSYFTQIVPFDFNSDSTYGLLLTITPKWSFETGHVHLEMHYRVLGADGQQLLDATATQVAQINSPALLSGFPNTARRDMQQVFVNLLQQLHPSNAKFPASAKMSATNRNTLVDKSRPALTGTGFYINKGGELMTAAHVTRDCAVIEAQKDNQTFAVSPKVSSDLLDVAILDTGRTTDKSLPLRTGEDLMLGEAVTNVGYPLQGLLADTPNLTRGNVSARAGLKGSMGLFQFSAPIQPGASGGPVVSDGGELLGVTVSTLNAAALIKDGLLPQNVNFALDARYVAMFLRYAKVDFVEVPASTKGDMKTANDAALSAVVQLSCYQ